VNLSELAAQWRAQADDMDRSAKSYNRACVKYKGVQLILLAKQLRACASSIEKTEEYANAQAADSKPQAGA
jgi:hypothetical protein